MPRPSSALEPLTAAVGAAAWLLGGAALLVLRSGRDDEGFDVIGTGLLFLVVAAPGGLCAVVTLVLLAACVVRTRGRLRVVTWLLAFVPALGGVAVLAELADREPPPAELPVQQVPPQPGFTPPPQPGFTPPPLGPG